MARTILRPLAKETAETGREVRARISSSRSAVVERATHPFYKENLAIMGIGVSLLLIAVGAVLAFAVHVTTSGFNINTVGIILLVVGAIGALISLIFWSSWGGFGSARGDTTIIER